ncbi:MAG: hypothetical protein V3R87_04780 [Dehalococcoidia bacterium]
MTEQAQDEARDAEVQSSDGTGHGATDDPQTRTTQLEERVAFKDSELAALKESLNEAVAKYRAAVLSSAPGVPEELIHGQTLEEIDASLEKARSITSNIRSQLQAEAQAIQVPAGAPGRQPASLEGLSGEALIAHALKTERR